MASTLSSGMRKMNRILSGTFTAAGGHNFATGTITFINIKKGAAISLTNPTTGSGTTIELYIDDKLIDTKTTGSLSYHNWREYGQHVYSQEIDAKI